MPVGWNHLTMTPSADAIGELRSAWSWLLPSNYQPVLFSSFGDMFYEVPTGEIWWLNTGTAELSKVAESKHEFQQFLGTELVNDWFLPPLIEDLVKREKSSVKDAASLCRRYLHSRKSQSSACQGALRIGRGDPQKNIPSSRRRYGENQHY